MTLASGLSAFADPAFLAKGENVKVMPVGDSITLGKDGGVGGYRRVLYEWLLAGGYKITYVGKQNLTRHGPATCSDGSIPWHEGYGSFRTDMILNGGKAEKETAPPLTTTLENFKPDLVLLMLGTNDIIQAYQLDGLEAREEKIIETIYAANPKAAVVVASIAPIKRAQWAEKETRVVAYNTALAALVEKHAAQGRRIAFADVHASLGERGLSGDGVHPNAQGYAQVAQVFYRVLTGAEPPLIDKKNPLLVPATPTSAAPSPLATPATPATSAANAVMPKTDIAK